MPVSRGSERAVRTAVVTGASSGIGAACARRLAALGFHVQLVARRADRLAALAAEIGGTAIPLDVTDAGAVRAFAAGVPACSALVNVAGGAFGADPVADADPQQWLDMYAVNVLGSLHMTQALLPALRRSGDGTLVFVTSTAARVAYEGGAGYCAAKAGQHMLAAGLRLELCGEPVRVVEVSPGMVRTDEFSLNRFGGDRARADAVYAGVDEPLLAEDVAECVAFAVTADRHVNVDELTVRPRAQAAQHKVHRRGA